MKGVYRSVHFKVFDSEKKQSEKFVFYPEPGKMWNQVGLELAKSDFAEKLKAAFPGNEFQFVKIKPDRFNVIPCPINQTKLATLSS